MRDRILLTICIPTSNRSNFLRIMLQALLPQVAEHSDLVEVWILDNASTDETSKILQESATLGPFSVKRQNENVGPVRNIVDGPTNLASGEYVWILGDHNLLRPRALTHILQTITANRHYDAFYVNFRTAQFPEQWPTVAMGGFDGEYDAIANPLTQNCHFDHWSKLLRTSSSLCTQNYVHILKTDHWQRCWKNKRIGQDFSNFETTYPHTYTAVSTVFSQPAYFISSPQFTIFNGAQSWAAPSSRLKVCLLGLPDYLLALKKLGIPVELAEQIQNEYVVPMTRYCIRESIRKVGYTKTIWLSTCIAIKKTSALLLLANTLTSLREKSTKPSTKTIFTRTKLATRSFLSKLYQHLKKIRTQSNSVNSNTEIHDNKPQL